MDVSANGVNISQRWRVYPASHPNPDWEMLQPHTGELVIDNGWINYLI